MISERRATLGMLAKPSEADAKRFRMAAVTMALLVIIAGLGSRGMSQERGDRQSLQRRAEKALAKLLPEGQFAGPFSSALLSDRSHEADTSTEAQSVESSLWWREEADGPRRASAATIPTKSGTVTFLALFSEEGAAESIIILSTTGRVNARLRSPLWQRRIRVLPEVEKLVPRKNIDAVSGATLSLQALCDAVNEMSVQIRGVRAGE